MIASVPARRQSAVGLPATGATAASVPGVPVFRAASVPSASGWVDLGIFQWTGAAWEHLGDWQDACRASAHPRVYLATWQDTISVLLVDRTSRMVQLRRGQWQEVTLPAELARGEPLGLTARGGSRGVIIALAVPAEPTAQGDTVELHLVIQDVPDGPFWSQRILRGEQPATWLVKHLPQVTAQRDQLVLLWRGDPDANGERPWHFARCDPLTGQLIAAGTVSGPGRGTGDGGGLEWLGYVSWGLLLAVLLSATVIRGRSPHKPFALPEGVRPAPLPRRLVALIVDLGLFYMLLSPAAFWFLPQDSPEELAEELRRALRQGAQAGDGAIQPVLISVLLAMLVLFGAYGAVMEARFGATLGKLIVRLRVVGEQAARATFRQCVARNVMKLVEIALLASPFFVVVLLVLLLNRNRQRLGDVLARTTVVDAGASAPAGRANDDGRPPSEPSDGDDHAG